jgi:hypothetical protein
MGTLDVFTLSGDAVSGATLAGLRDDGCGLMEDNSPFWLHTGELTRNVFVVNGDNFVLCHIFDKVSLGVGSGTLLSAWQFFRHWAVLRGREWLVILRRTVLKTHMLHSNPSFDQSREQRL